MKLRIKGNSLRLRLSRAETETFAADGLTADAIVFPDGSRLDYAFERSAGAETSVAFDGRRIRVSVPAAQAAAWLTGDGGLSFEQVLPNGEQLNVLVEKDFQCLHRRTDEDESGLFPHPAQR